MKTTANLTSQGHVDQVNVNGKVTTNPLQPKAADGEEGLLQMAGEEEELLQKKENPLQLKYTGDNPLKPVTHTGNPLQQIPPTPVQKKENKTGLPDQLKSGVENLSGYAMDDVKVHYNSSQPAQLNALAYAQGTDIHVGPGQEKHLPHEAWHIVQQMQGRVQPTMQMKEGVDINDDKGLENEADFMGAKAVHTVQRKYTPQNLSGYRAGIIQRIGDKMAMGYEDKLAMRADIREIREEVENIYNRHKTTKKAQRSALDVQFTQQSDKLEERQEYLINAIKYALYELIDEGGHAGDIDFSAEMDKAHDEMVNLELPDAMKYSLLAKGRTLATTILPVLSQEMQARDEAKRKKADWKSKMHPYCTSYGRHAIADPIVQGYEKGYKASAMDRKVLIKDWVDFAKTKKYDLAVTTESDIGKVTVEKDDKSEATKFHVATVYFNDQRFQKVEGGDVVLPDGERREVFKHREKDKQYVKDAQNLFVKRYVKRALNKYDNPDDKSRGVEISADPRKKSGSEDTWAHIATKVPGMSSREKDAEIQNHQRAKEAQGGSPFVSFTTTDHPIFGSSAKLFESDRGMATVDLARISKSKIFDTHTSEAMKRIHGIDKPNPDMPYREGDVNYEKNSAARDAMRTRELVVAGDIPKEAITAVEDQSGAYVKGAEGKFQPPEHAIKSYLAGMTSEQSALVGSRLFH